MFLRPLVLALLLANLGYFAYSQGWLESITGGDSAQREPERLAKQVNADAIDIKTAPPGPPANACTPKKSEQWVVYMGPYATGALADKKKEELKRMGIAAKNIAQASRPIGLSLAQFDSEALAQTALKTFAGKGVKTASVRLWGMTTIPCPTP